MDPFQDPASAQSVTDPEGLMASTPGRKRVGWSSDTAPTTRPTSQVPEEDTGSAGLNTPLQRSDVSQDDLYQMRESIRKALAEEYPNAGPSSTPPREVQKPRPAIRKAGRTPPEFFLNDEPNPFEDEMERLPSKASKAKHLSGIEAQRRAEKLSQSVGTYSNPVSRRSSYGRMSPPVELQHMARPYGNVIDAIDDEDEDDDPQFMKRATMILQSHSTRGGEAPALSMEDLYHTDTHIRSGQVTPPNAVEIEDEHVARPPKYRTGVLGTLLKVSTAAAHAPTAATDRQPYKPGHSRNLSAGMFNFSGASTAANTPNPSPPRSGTTTPRGKPWYSRGDRHQPSGSISQLVGSSARSFAAPSQQDLGHQFEEQVKKTRPGMTKRTKSDDSILGFKKPNKRREQDLKIKIHLAGTLARQSYLRKLCKALMMYGAPTHRLEEYMNMSARVLEIEAQFLYMPGCMIIAFDDSSVHTSEVKLVRTAQGVDLGKLRDVHEIYKDVVHDRIGVDEATPRLETIMERKNKFGRWLRVPVYGLASATVGPFAFGARPIDLPFCFLLGCIIGWLQLIVAPGNELISNVFEIGAAVITSFLARALGSIRDKNGNEIFCFSAMAQSSIALILPGFMVLCASLELQSKHIVAGSVRMVYAIIYSLFLGFGITIGTVLYGMMDHNATSRKTCREPMSSHYYYIFVVIFALCLMIVNQAKYKQMPSMAIIALIGYVVNFHSSQYFKNNAQVSNTLGALAIGIAANIHARFGRHLENWGLDLWENRLRPHFVKLRKRYLRSRPGPLSNVPKSERSEYSATQNSSAPQSSASSVSDFVPQTRKIGYGLAAAAMLPAIFVQVPSGLSVQGSLVSGLNSADQIVRNTTDAAISAADVTASSTLNSIALNVGFSVVQIAIGITVGLFLAALIVYPLGKKRSGLFSF